MNDVPLSTEAFEPQSGPTCEPPTDPLGSSPLDPLSDPPLETNITATEPVEPLFGDAPVETEPETPEIPVGELLLIKMTRTSTHRWQVHVRHAQTNAILALDTVDLATAGARDRLVKTTLKKLHLTNEQKLLVGVELEGVLVAKGLEAPPEATPSTVGEHLPIISENTGKWTSCQHNSKLWLLVHGPGKNVYYDQFLRIIFVGDKPVDDDLVAKTTDSIEQDLGVPWKTEHVRLALIVLGLENQRNPLTIWLDGLQWDGYPRLEKFFQYIYNAADTPYNSACARVMFLSAVARAYQPGCQADVMVVLIGAQGIGKSVGIRALCPTPDWFAEDIGGEVSDKKTAGEGLQGKWLVEIAELTRISRSSLDAVKSFITRKIDHYRPSYGRTTQDFPRNCIFIGTSNEDNPLQDEENRRFMPVRCVQGNIQMIVDNRDQLWAEAVARYRAGEAWWITDQALINDCKEQQEAARQQDPWVELLANKLSGIEQTSTSMAAGRLELKPHQLDKGAEMRIAAILRKLGYVRKQVREGTKRHWVFLRGATLQSSVVTT